MVSKRKTYLLPGRNEGRPKSNFSSITHLYALDVERIYVHIFTFVKQNVKPGATFALSVAQFVSQGEFTVMILSF